MLLRLRLGPWWAGLALLALSLAGCSSKNAAPRTSNDDTAETTTQGAGTGGFADSFETATPERPFRASADAESNVSTAGSPDNAPIDLGRLELPAGWTIALYTDQVTNARTLRRGGPGILYVSTRQNDKVYAVVDRDGDHQPEAVHTIASGLVAPNGLAYRDGTLFIAEIGRITRLDDIDNHLEDPPELVVVTEELPDEGHHGWRYIDFGPDGYLYVPVGAPCNICKREEPIFASMARLRIPESGPASALEVYAHGIRNSVGFAWHPRTRELWFTDNGGDGLGDNLPPDELNRAPEAGLHFGYPACHAGVIVDPEYGALRTCAESVPPVQNLGPHVAALGMEFTTGRGLPEPHANSVLIAEHGSWNRAEKLGYRITEVRLDGDRAVQYRPLISGWVDAAADQVYGRPVDLEFLDDGSLLISDDWQGAIYRVTIPRPGG